MMRILFTIIIFVIAVVIIGCNKQPKTAPLLTDVKDSILYNATNNVIDSTEKQLPEKVYFTEAQRIAFLDSIGQLSPKGWRDSVTYYVDSVYNSRKDLNITLSAADFEILKKGFNLKEDDAARFDFLFLKGIFPNWEPDSSFLKYLVEDDSTWVTIFSFDKNPNDFNEFAICLGAPSVSWESDVYFFKSNKIIAYHHIYHKHGFEIDFFKDYDGRTTLVYKECFGTGTGVWQFNYFFYKYFNNKLIPVLNILENGNLNGPNYRSFWLENFILSEKPLKMKMVYDFSLIDTINSRANFIKDSTIVTFRWNERLKNYVADYTKSKISQDKLFTYYPSHFEYGELLFMHAYCKELKNALQGSDTEKRNTVLYYINEMMNHYYFWESNSE